MFSDVALRLRERALELRHQLAWSRHRAFVGDHAEDHAAGTAEDAHTEAQAD